MAVVNIEAVLVSAKELLQLETMYSESQAALTAAGTELEAEKSTRLKTQAALVKVQSDLTAANTALAQSRAAQIQSQAEANTLIADLRKQLAEATKPPVVVPPVTPPPTKPLAPLISKSEIRNLRALTIEKGQSAPNDAMYTEVRNVMAKAKGMGFNCWRGFFNFEEVRKHLRLQATDINHLPAFGQKWGLAFVADTVDAMLPRLDIAGQTEYLQGLERMGALAVVINDADQYAQDELLEWTTRVRKTLPNMPIIASLTGTADISKYGMFDFREAQTFGKVTELKGFFDGGFDIFCLDARNAMSAVDITTRGAVILATKPDAVFYYTDLARDWINMSLDKQGAIRRVIEGLAAGT